MLVECPDRDRQKFKLLHVCAFTSARKRMSVIVREESGAIRLICKGADSIVAGILSRESRDSELFRTTQEAVDHYADEGLRTLFVAEREIAENDF